MTIIDMFYYIPVPAWTFLIMYSKAKFNKSADKVSLFSGHGEQEVFKLYISLTVGKVKCLIKHFLETTYL